MGCVENISAYKYPKQSEYVNRRVKVCFHYDTANMFGGRIVRDDREDPCETIIQMDDGRFVRAVECQYSISRE